MIKEIGHFLRNGKDASKLQRQYPRAEFVDVMSAKADQQGYAEVRRELVADLEGKVLEIGCGCGTMFEYYGPKAQLEAIEPEEDFLALAVNRAAKSGGKIHASLGDGMNLEFADDTFDAVVLGLVLCSVPSVERVVAEAFRVLRPGGHLRALEHVRSEASVAGFLMDVSNPLWRLMNRQGCNWNRNPIVEIQAAGFEMAEVIAFKRFDTVLPAFPMRQVKARKAAASALQH